MVRRKTIDDDLDRLAENLFISEGDLISDRDSFELALNNYLVEEGLSKNSKDKLFEIYVNDHPDVSKERLFKKAKGKDLERDRQQTARTVVKTKEEFVKKGASKVDFAGFDVKESKIRKQKVEARKGFEIASKVKDKVVFSKKVFVVVQGKRQVRHRDKLGRFTSIK